MENDRPEIPPDLATVKAEQAAALVASFKHWFAKEEIREHIERSAARTRDYLIAYKQTPNLHGGAGASKPWVRIEGKLLPELLRTDNQMRLDLRISGLRLKTWSEGACRMVGILNENEALPGSANTYNDDSTNVIEWFLHEQLIRAHFAAAAEERDPKTLGIFTLSNLLSFYLYKEASPQDVMRAKIVQMVSVGLWDADPPVGARAWKIRAGPVAIAFHQTAFFPVVEHFKQFL